MIKHIVMFKLTEKTSENVLIAHFENREGLKIYGAHENHLPIVKIMRSLCSSSIVVDFER